MTHDPMAGHPAKPEMLIDPAKLEHEYYTRHLDVDDRHQLVSFGTSGHRGTPRDGSFNEPHILAITQATCDYRRIQGINGPLLIGRDTHALSGPAHRTALEVLAANRVETVIQEDDDVTPTPAISRSILVYNSTNKQRQADGIVVTPSHNPPEDGGFKYNPTHGGPAQTDVTSWIQGRANTWLRQGTASIGRVQFEEVRSTIIRTYDFRSAYINDLRNVVDMDAIRANGLKLGEDPLGGAAVHYWDQIENAYGLDLVVVNPRVDPTFAFMTVDHDGKNRMDCSSPYAMAGLVAVKDRFAVAWANDTYADRHGIVTPTSGLMNPNHFLAVATQYLLQHRTHSPKTSVVGKTLVSNDGWFAVRPSGTEDIYKMYAESFRSPAHLDPLWSRHDRQWKML